ncbi:hypothetical protein B0H14DRAFT_2630666 [Mycena olivaceomarginata]|nr:hypothetical protein B0H14DRAFT_2630666 [Mycena olivaceomarginata]
MLDYHGIDLPAPHTVNEALCLDTLALPSRPVPEYRLARSTRDEVHPHEEGHTCRWTRIENRSSLGNSPTRTLLEEWLLVLSGTFPQERLRQRPEPNILLAAHELTRDPLLQKPGRNPKKPLLERLQLDANDGNRALMDRMEIGLKDQISSTAPTKRRRAHNRPQKRLERLLRMEEEIRREWEEFKWTDTEIDWFIDLEESLPVRDEEDDDRMD